VLTKPDIVRNMAPQTINPQNVQVMLSVIFQVGLLMPNNSKAPTYLF
jgi:hypothetical protein